MDALGLPSRRGGNGGVPVRHAIRAARESRTHPRGAEERGPSAPADQAGCPGSNRREVRVISSDLGLEALPPDALAAHQARLLQTVVAHAAESPFYAAKFGQAGLSSPAKIGSLDDLAR